MAGGDRVKPSEEELVRYLKRVEPMMCKTCPIEGFCKSGYSHDICSAQDVLRRLLKGGKISTRDVRGALRLG